nr:hypothetical protein [Desulforamulus profundi]
MDTASIKSEIQKSRAAKQEEKAPAEKETPAEKSADDFLDELMAKPDQPEPERTDNPNSTMDLRRRRRRNPLRPSLLTSAAGKPPGVRVSRSENPSGRN